MVDCVATTVFGGQSDSWLENDMKMVCNVNWFYQCQNIYQNVPSTVPTKIARSKKAWHVQMLHLFEGKRRKLFFFLTCGQWMICCRKNNNGKKLTLGLLFCLQVVRACRRDVVVNFETHWMGMVEIWGIKKKYALRAIHTIHTLLLLRMGHMGSIFALRFAPIVAESMLMMRSTVDIVARNERHVT